MPDLLNKQSIVNLLIDSPLREPIKINLIDIVNNTAEVDLPKVYSTIVKELEIFQKATERRMKLADETIAKLSGTTPAESPTTETTTPSTPQTTTEPATPITPPPTPTPAPVAQPAQPLTQPEEPTGLTATNLDLPPASEMPKLQSAPANDMATPAAPPVSSNPAPTPNFQPLGGAPMTSSSDEEALAEIQKELDSLKTSTAQEVANTAASTAPSTPPTPAQ